MNTNERIVISFTLKDEEHYEGEVLRGCLDGVDQGGCVVSGPWGMGEAEAVDGARRFVLSALAARWGLSISIRKRT